MRAAWLLLRALRVAFSTVLFCLWFLVLGLGLLSVLCFVFLLKIKKSNLPLPCSWTTQGSKVCSKVIRCQRRGLLSLRPPSAAGSGRGALVKSAKLEAG